MSLDWKENNLNDMNINIDSVYLEDFWNDVENIDNDDPKIEKYMDDSDITIIPDLLIIIDWDIDTNDNKQTLWEYIISSCNINFEDFMNEQNKVANLNKYISIDQWNDYYEEFNNLTQNQKLDLVNYIVNLNHIYDYYFPNWWRKKNITLKWMDDDIRVQNRSIDFANDILNNINDLKNWNISLYTEWSDLLNEYKLRWLNLALDYYFLNWYSTDILSLVKSWENDSYTLKDLWYIINNCYNDINKNGDILKYSYVFSLYNKFFSYKWWKVWLIETQIGWNRGVYLFKDSFYSDYLKNYNSVDEINFDKVFFTSWLNKYIRFNGNSWLKKFWMDKILYTFKYYKSIESNNLQNGIIGKYNWFVDKITVLNENINSYAKIQDDWKQYIYWELNIPINEFRINYPDKYSQYILSKNRYENAIDDYVITWTKEYLWLLIDLKNEIWIKNLDDLNKLEKYFDKNSIIYEWMSALITWGRYVSPFLSKDDTIELNFSNYSDSNSDIKNIDNIIIDSWVEKFVESLKKEVDELKDNPLIFAVDLSSVLISSFIAFESDWALTWTSAWINTTARFRVTHNLIKSTWYWVVNTIWWWSFIEWVGLSEWFYWKDSDWNIVTLWTDNMILNMWLDFVSDAVFFKYLPWITKTVTENMEKKLLLNISSPFRKKILLWAANFWSELMFFSWIWIWESTIYSWITTTMNSTWNIYENISVWIDAMNKTFQQQLTPKNFWVSLVDNLFFLSMLKLWQWIWNNIYWLWTKYYDKKITVKQEKYYEELLKKWAELEKYIDDNWYVSKKDSDWNVIFVNSDWNNIFDNKDYIEIFNDFKNIQQKMLNINWLMIKSINNLAIDGKWNFDPNSKKILNDYNNFIKKNNLDFYTISPEQVIEDRIKFYTDKYNKTTSLKEKAYYLNKIDDWNHLLFVFKGKKSDYLNVIESSLSYRLNNIELSTLSPNVLEDMFLSDDDMQISIVKWLSDGVDSSISTDKWKESVKDFFSFINNSSNKDIILEKIDKIMSEYTTISDKEKIFKDLNSLLKVRTLHWTFANNIIKFMIIFEWLFLWWCSNSIPEQINIKTDVVKEYKLDSLAWKYYIDGDYLKSADSDSELWNLYFSYVDQIEENIEDNNYSDLELDSILEQKNNYMELSLMHLLYSADSYDKWNDFVKSRDVYNEIVKLLDDYSVIEKNPDLYNKTMYDLSKWLAILQMHIWEYDWNSWTFQYFKNAINYTNDGIKKAETENDLWDAYLEYWKKQKNPVDFYNLALSAFNESLTIKKTQYNDFLNVNYKYKDYLNILDSNYLQKKQELLLTNPNLSQMFFDYEHLSQTYFGVKFNIAKTNILIEEFYKDSWINSNQSNENLIYKYLVESEKVFSAVSPKKSEVNFYIWKYCDIFNKTFDGKHSIDFYSESFDRLYWFDDNWNRVDDANIEENNIWLEVDVAWNIRQHYLDLYNSTKNNDYFVKALEFSQKYLFAYNYQQDLKLKEQESAQTYLNQLNNTKKTNQELEEQNKKRKNFMYWVVVLLLLSSLVGTKIYIDWKKIKKIDLELNSQNTELEILKIQLSTKNTKLERLLSEMVSALNAGKNLQQAILFPYNDMMKKIYWDNIWIQYHPKDQVWWDFYWFKSTDDYDIILAWDCSGHWVVWWLLTTFMLSEFEWSDFSNWIWQWLNNINSNMNRQFGVNDDFWQYSADLTMIKIDKKNKILNFWWARNPLILYHPDWTISKYKTTKASLDWWNNSLFVDESINYNTWDIAFMFSDWASDIFGWVDNWKLWQKRFRQILVDVLSGKVPEWFENYLTDEQKNKITDWNLSVEEVVELMKVIIVDWYAWWKQIDDFLIIWVKLD